MSSKTIAIICAIADGLAILAGGVGLATKPLKTKLEKEKQEEAIRKEVARQLNNNEEED